MFFFARSILGKTEKYYCRFLFLITDNTFSNIELMSNILHLISGCGHKHSATALDAENYL